MEYIVIALAALCVVLLIAVYQLNKKVDENDASYSAIIAKMVTNVNAHTQFINHVIKVVQLQGIDETKVH